MRQRQKERRKERGWTLSSSPIVRVREKVEVRGKSVYVCEYESETVRESVRERERESQRERESLGERDREQVDAVQFAVIVSLFGTVMLGLMMLAAQIIPGHDNGLQAQ
jgi:hypothetical protein